jgi:hypothetical protein
MIEGGRVDHLSVRTWEDLIKIVADLQARVEELERDRANRELIEFTNRVEADERT